MRAKKKKMGEGAGGRIILTYFFEWKRLIVPRAIYVMKVVIIFSSTFVFESSPHFLNFQGKIITNYSSRMEIHLNWEI